MTRTDDMRELAGLSLAETIDAMQVVSEGALARRIEPGILSARIRLLAARLTLEAARHLRGCAGNRQTARCSRQTPARGAVGPRQSGESAAFVPQMRTRACDRNRLTSISNVVMARDFWLQALESSCVIASRTSTGVREIPLGSPRVLETFWARSGRDTNRGVNMELQKPELAAALTSPARTSSAAGLRSLNYGVDRY